MTSEDPTPFSALIIEQHASLPPDSRMRAVLEAARDGHRRNQRRRAAVLEHDDLRRCLEQPPLSFRRASQWNGYVPPAIVNPGEPEVLRQVRRMQDNTVRYWLNPKSKRTRGEIPNDSPQRAALMDISAEAWRRERLAHDAADMQPPAAGETDPLSEHEHAAAQPAGAARPAGLHDPGSQLNGHDRRVTP